MNAITRITWLTLSVIGFSQCNDEVTIEKDTCSTPAIVRDKTGLDGCGFVFELNDGTYLQPVIIAFCGTEPFSNANTEDPLASFQLVDGKHVYIDFEEVSAMSGCMNGKSVRITCISEKPLPTED
jgi:hypothetical protein